MTRVNTAHVKVSCLPQRAVNLPAITAAPLIQEVLSNKCNKEDKFHWSSYPPRAVFKFLAVERLTQLETFITGKQVCVPGQALARRVSSFELFEDNKIRHGARQIPDVWLSCRQLPLLYHIPGACWNSKGPLCQCPHSGLPFSPDLWSAGVKGDYFVDGVLCLPVSPQQKQ